MDRRFQRTELLFGKEAMERLAASRVAVFGIGGVGGYAVEVLARSGVGRLDLIDSDTVDVTNINRQILATTATVGLPKVQAAAERIALINPACVVEAHQVLYLPDTRELFDFRDYDYVVDAIDTVTGKLLLAEEAWRAGTPIIASMGAGNKLDPTAFEVADIYETSVCPLARVMRRELKKRGIPALKCVYSRETPAAAFAREEDAPAGRRGVPASCAFVPSVAGLILGGEVIKDLAGAAGSGRKKE